MGPKLITKLTVVTSGIILVTVGLSSWYDIQSVEHVLLEETVDRADNLSETILKTTHHQMLEDDRHRVHQMIEEVGTQKGIDFIRLINKDGTVIFSTFNEEIGERFDKRAAEACNICHTDEKTLTHASSMNRSRIFHNPEGEEVLGMVKGIYNQDSCSSAACHFHAPETKLLGILDVAVSLKGMQEQVQAMRLRIILATMILLAVLSMALTVMTQRLVHRPIKNLLEHSRALARGEWRRITSVPADEFGELAEAYNDMTENLKKAHHELADWNLTLEQQVEARMSQIKRMQNELIRSEKLASLGELVAGIAHELNNPLTGIIMFASLVDQDPRLDISLKEDFATIVREAQRCSAIVHHLLNFSRESKPEKTWHSLNRLVEETLPLVVNQALFQNIVIKKDYYPDLPEILIDAGQVMQVLVNVVINAGQAMPEGGELKISTGFEVEQGMVMVQVADTGCGISPENLEKIFDPFFSTKGHRGTGLGLSVSYGIMENHGGRIEVVSRKGKGTVFTLRFPVPGMAVGEGEGEGKDLSGSETIEEPYTISR